MVEVISADASSRGVLVKLQAVKRNDVADRKAMDLAVEEAAKKGVHRGAIFGTPDIYPISLEGEVHQDGSPVAIRPVAFVAEYQIVPGL